MLFDSKGDLQSFLNGANPGLTHLVLVRRSSELHSQSVIEPQRILS